MESNSYFTKRNFQCYYKVRFDHEYVKQSKQADDRSFLQQI